MNGLELALDITLLILLFAIFTCLNIAMLYGLFLWLAHFGVQPFKRWFS